MLSLISLIYIVGGWSQQWDTSQPWVFLAWLCVLFGSFPLTLVGQK